MENNALEWFRVPQKIYFKRGCLPIALRELKEVYDRKRIVVLINSFSFLKGNAKPVTDVLNELNIFYSVITVEDEEESVLIGLDAVRKFEPDCIIAVGRIAISAGKLIRILYENPELTFDQLAERKNLRDRTLRSLKTGKVYFVAAADSSCGEEVRPDSTLMKIGDTRLHTTFTEVQDYALLPDMSIIDTDLLMLENPVKTAAFLSLKAVSNALYIVQSPYSSDYTEGLAVHAMKLIFRYFPECQKNPADVYASERIFHALEMTCMAFGNVAAEPVRLMFQEDFFSYDAAASALGITPEELQNRFHQLYVLVEKYYA